MYRKQRSRSKLFQLDTSRIRKLPALHTHQLNNQDIAMIQHHQNSVQQDKMCRKQQSRWNNYQHCILCILLLLLEQKSLKDMAHIHLTVQKSSTH